MILLRCTFRAFLVFIQLAIGQAPIQNLVHAGDNQVENYLEENVTTDDVALTCAFFSWMIRAKILHSRSTSLLQPWQCLLSL